MVALRPAHKPYGNMWEIPGGKLEDKEGYRKALCRELYEELGMSWSHVIFVGSSVKVWVHLSTSTPSVLGKEILKLWLLSVLHGPPWMKVFLQVDATPLTMVTFHPPASIGVRISLMVHFFQHQRMRFIFVGAILCFFSRATILDPNELSTCSNDLRDLADYIRYNVDECVSCAPTSLKSMATPLADTGLPRPTPRRKKNTCPCVGPCEELACKQ